MKQAKVISIKDGAVKLDFGPNWGYLLVPKRSKELKGMDLKEGDKIEVVFQRRGKW